ncbi:MAG: hypothetical protein ACYTDX_00285 [Planctomycetota bacterium]|jgi:hypothetical protein
MKRKRMVTALLLLALAAGTGACASNDEPYTAPQTPANSRIPRAPVVAPTGQESPWWWMLPESWW